MLDLNPEIVDVISVTGVTYGDKIRYNVYIFLTDGTMHKHCKITKTQKDKILKEYNAVLIH